MKRELSALKIFPFLANSGVRNEEQLKNKMNFAKNRNKNTQRICGISKQELRALIPCENK